MARAGYCSGCGNYVFLRPDGGCSNGHGPEYVSNPYEVPDAPAAPPAAPQPAPAYQAPPAYQPPAAQPYAAQPAYAAPAAPPKKKRTGLIVTILLLVLLLCCCGGVVGGIVTGVVPNPLGMLTSAEHQKVQAAGDFFEALSTKNVVQLMRIMPADAVAAADAAFWTKTLLTDTTAVTAVTKSWNGDVLTMKATDSEGVKQEIVFRSGEDDRVLANTATAGEDSGDDQIIVMKKELDGWKVYSLGEGADAFITFDAASIKKLQEENK